MAVTEADLVGRVPAAQSWAARATVAGAEASLVGRLPAAQGSPSWAAEAGLAALLAAVEKADHTGQVPATQG